MSLCCFVAALFSRCPSVFTAFIFIFRNGSVSLDSVPLQCPIRETHMPVILQAKESTVPEF